MKSVFVDNMNFQTTERDLRALFEPFGASNAGAPADALSPALAPGKTSDH